MHPLGTNLRELSDDDLHKKLADLNKRFMQAYRIGPFQVIPQLQMLIQDYNEEVSRRNAVKMQELQEKLEKSSKKEEGKGIKGIIDIK
jgi:hypothetical protein